MLQKSSVSNNLTNFNNITLYVDNSLRPDKFVEPSTSQRTGLTTDQSDTKGDGTDHETKQSQETVFPVTT